MPDDAYGVLVKDDMDRRRLTWLAGQIGEAKLRRSVEKRALKWPGSKPYVSTMLKRFRLSVPPAVYAPVRVPIYSVYVLVILDGSAIKIGMSGNWLQRATNVSLRAVIYEDEPSLFDLDKSVAFVCQTKAAALLTERVALAATEDMKCAPSGVCFGFGGRSEWRSGKALWLITSLLSEQTHRPPVTLREEQRRAELLVSSIGLAI